MTSLIKAELRDGGYVLLDSSDLLHLLEACSGLQPSDEALTQIATAIYNPDGSLLHLRRLSDLPAVADFVDRDKPAEELMAEPLLIMQWRAAIAKSKGEFQ